VTVLKVDLLRIDIFVTLKNTVNHTSCLICGSENLKKLDDYKNVELSQCSQCSFVFCTEIPSKEELVEFYTKNYDRTRYFSPITRKRYEELLDSFEKHRKTNKILDIGAGYGFFLEIAKEKGWDVYGTELSSEATEDCEKKGITMYAGELQDCTFEDESFDVIVSIECLEHLNNPNSYAEKAFQLLRTGGVFYLTTPNYNSYLRYRLGDKYDVIEYPNHLTYYTRKTLRKLFERNQFKTVKIQSTGMSITRLRTSKGRSNQEYVSQTSDDEMIRYRIEKSRGLRLSKRIVNGILDVFKVGVSLKGIFIKK